MAQSTLYMECDYADFGYVAGDEVCRPYYGGGWEQKQLARMWLPKPPSAIEQAIKRIARELDVTPDDTFTEWVKVQTEDMDEPEDAIREMLQELVPPPPPPPEDENTKAMRLWSSITAKTRH
jgi:hypothetical protein